MAKSRVKKTEKSSRHSGSNNNKYQESKSNVELQEKTYDFTYITLTAEDIINDYRLGYQSRHASILGRREVMSGKAKFGIFGDGKEVAQLAMAKAFQKGDFRSGYYRDQTMMFAIGEHSIYEFFAQLYAHPDEKFDPATAGRAMNAHFATRSLNPDGSWKNLTDMKNSAADLSPTASQMPRLVGLAYASRLYRELEELKQFTNFSNNGNEIAFGTIGNASCAEGMFWETINAIGLMKAPMLLSIWDDEYGISVPNKYQLTKGNISELLKGFQYDPDTEQGFALYTVKGWDYSTLIETYLTAAQTTRKEHIPAIIHIVEMTQPQGHSTSGSHERYKSEERLDWERETDCLKKMREWMVAEGIATDEEMDAMEEQDRKTVENIRNESWEAFQQPIREYRKNLVNFIDTISPKSEHATELQDIKKKLTGLPAVTRKSVMAALRNVLITIRNEDSQEKQNLIQWKNKLVKENNERFSSHLYSLSSESALNVEEVKPVYAENSPKKNGFEVLNAYFDSLLSRDSRVIAFGEDVGYLGDVNQAFKGLQSKFGELRVSDTGIREITIIGQAIGMAMRGLRPVAEIQYLDYLLYALQLISDDLACLHWRTKGGQKAPVIIRTRGHRLEGIWHAGSPMGGITHLIRGIHVLVPRNMTQAAGFYNTLIKSDEPGLVVEVLNGYRLKEKLPDNFDEITVPLGVPEILKPGTDVTIVTYGACCRLAIEAAELLEKTGVNAEVIDVQSLLPFDLNGVILESLKKTNRIVFVDEDVPGGATAYMMQEVVEKQGGYYWLDSEPRTLPAKPHRPAYATDGDYFSKPNVEQIFETVYDLIHEADPQNYPIFYR